MKQHLTDEFLIVLWLGILTGAMLVTLAFTYQSISNQALESSILRSSIKTRAAVETVAPSTTTTSESIIGPGM